MANKETIDFGGVPTEIGARSRHIPPGDYVAKIVSVEKKWKDNDKSNSPYFNWKMQVNAGPETGATLFTNTSLKPDALFNLRNLIFAVRGVNVAGKSLNFDPDSLVGQEVGIVVDDDEWNDKIRSNIVDFRSASELTGDGGGGGGKKKKKKKAVEEVDEDDEDDMDTVDLDKL